MNLFYGELILGNIGVIKVIIAVFLLLQGFY
jgi:hypothetical protein